MTKILKQEFEERLKEAVTLINEYGICYEKIGVFGSYARETYKGTSDIDICLIVNKKPSRRISGELRELCEMKGVDIVFVTPDYFEHGSDRFAVKLRRDWREIHEKYPGDSFVTVTRGECSENIAIMYDVIEEVNHFRKRNDLPVIEIERQELKISNE